MRKPKLLVKVIGFLTNGFKLNMYYQQLKTVEHF